MGDLGIWKDVLEVARRAPSPHNVQPWKLKILGEREADLYIDTCRTLPKEDLTGSFLLLAMGLFIEALRVLCRNRGFELSWSFHGDLDAFPPLFEKARPRSLLFARLTIRPEEGLEVFYEDAVFLKRRTSRLSYDARLVSGDALEALGRVASRWRHAFVPIPDPETIAQLSRWDTDALFEDMNNRAYHDEIVEYFRFSDRESAAKRDGLDFRCMNFSRFDYWVAARLPWLMKVPILSALMKKKYHRQFEPIHQMGFLAGKFWKAEEGFEAGRFLLHFWLELSRLGLFMHPFGNLVTNPTAAAHTHEKFGRKDIWLIFRMGHSPVPPESRRLHVDELLLD